MIVANLQYCGIIFAALFGQLLFGDRIQLIGWAGMATIIASGIVATFLRARALPQPPCDAPRRWQAPVLAARVGARRGDVQRERGDLRDD